MSIVRTFAVKFGYEADSNQELVALGLANVRTPTRTKCCPRATFVLRVTRLLNYHLPAQELSREYIEG